MSIRSIAAFLLVAVLALGGCVQLESHAVLNKDGSGTYTFRVSMSQEVEQALQELKDLDGSASSDMEDVPDFTTIDRDKLEQAFKGHDCKLKSFSNEVADGKRTVEAVVEFKNLDGLQAAITGLTEEGKSYGIFRGSDGNYVLKMVELPASEEESEVEEEQEQPEDMQKAMENASKAMAIMGKLMAHANELSVTNSITFPSDVISHNGTRIDGRTVYWEMNSSNMMGGMDMDPNVVFSGKGVKLDVPALD